MTLRKKLLLFIAALLSLLIIFILYFLNAIPHVKYHDQHFNIQSPTSANDADHDGIDDYTDIVNSARDYVATKPHYLSKYYATGYPDDNNGVCTDVVAFALLGAGYDLQQLVNDDIKAAPEAYNISKPDGNIDFRRVPNLNVYFSRHATSLTTDPDDIKQWQGGDIVVFPHHIGIVSDVRNFTGTSFVIHHGSNFQFGYEQDILEKPLHIIGHYRIESPLT